MLYSVKVGAFPLICLHPYYSDYISRPLFCLSFKGILCYYPVKFYIYILVTFDTFTFFCIHVHKLLFPCFPSRSVYDEKPIEQSDHRYGLLQRVSIDLFM